MTVASIPNLLLGGSSQPAEASGAGRVRAGVLHGDDAAAATVSAGVPTFVDFHAGLFSADSPLVRAHSKLFAIRLDDGAGALVDPRRPDTGAGWARIRADARGGWEAVGDDVRHRLDRLAGAGIAGIVLRGAHTLGGDLLAQLAGHTKSAGLSLLVAADGLGDEQLGALANEADGFVIDAAGLSDATLVTRREQLRAAGPVWIEMRGTEVEPGRAALADGAIGHDLSQETAMQLAQWLDRVSRYDGEVRVLSGPASPVARFVRGRGADLRHAEEALLLLANRFDTVAPVPADFGAFQAADLLDTPLAPGELRAVPARRAPAVCADVPADGDAITAAEAPRLVLEGIGPSVEGGAFPVKRVVGDTVSVEALLYGDGHEQLAAELQWRAIDEVEWQVARMEQLPNDRWRATLALSRLGRHEFAVEGWLDRFGGFQRDFGKKRDAGVAASVDFDEGRLLVEQALSRADRETAARIAEWLARFDDAAGEDDRAALLLAPDIAALMDLADDRPHRIRSASQWIDAERLEARFSSWYELFPRSITDDKARHGTFADVIGRLPAIRAMGFDTLYFPPIHPIGRTNRKGPNNTLTPGPDDVGSPYAIGSADGGHDAIHPALGSFADFARLVAAARDHGLEIAIDFAIQCSPDHPWLKEHSGWFAWRPDGSMKYAENPPKKYQDIVNVDFYGPDAVPDLWLALRDVVLLWAEQGVKAFRVDNPHTKPLPFWEWMIGEVRALHPDAIFLAEAFTRPSMMYRLAKIGFSQSYTYFTWRNGKQELADYITELTTTAPREFYRPHFFVNTPDINPPYLQTSGRPGFRIRAVLAATLSGLFGVYSGFELCESAPIPGREEYLDSEKYEIRPRDHAAPGNIIADITLLNRLRRTHPALQTHLNTRFYIARNDNILYYGKPAPDGSDMILVMVNLDPHQPREASFEVPLWEFGLPDDGAVQVEDLAGGYRFEWRGKDQWIRLDPQEPYRIWRIWSAA